MDTIIQLKDTTTVIIFHNYFHVGLRARRKYG